LLLLLLLLENFPDRSYFGSMKDRANRGKSGRPDEGNGQGNRPLKVRVHSEKESLLTIENSKLTLSLAARVRQHDACLMTTIIVPSSHSIASAMEAAGKEFNLKKQQDKGALTVPPYIFAWSSAVLAAIEV